jgi:hypothetical protein
VHLPTLAVAGGSRALQASVIDHEARAAFVVVQLEAKREGGSPGRFHSTSSTRCGSTIVTAPGIGRPSQRCTLSGSLSAAQISAGVAA